MSLFLLVPTVDLTDFSLILIWC